MNCEHDKSCLDVCIEMPLDVLLDISNNIPTESSSQRKSHAVFVIVGNNL
jgi:hypothetical protein